MISNKKIIKYIFFLLLQSLFREFFHPKSFKKIEIKNFQIKTQF